MLFFLLHPNKKVQIIIIAIVFIVFSCNIATKDKSNFSEIEGIHAAFYNSKGDKISLSTTKGRLILTDTALNIIKTSKVHKGTANSSFFSLDDKYIISGGNDSVLCVNDANTLEKVKNYYFGIYFWTSIHGNNTLGGCGENGALLIYDKKSNDTIIEYLERDGAFHLYYIKPDTNLVVSSGKSGYEFNIINKKVEHIYRGHKDWVYCIMPSNDLNKIVTASKDSTVKVFDRFTQETLHTSNKLDGPVYVACFDPTDQIIAASTSNGSIYFMDSTLSNIIMTIKAFDTRINTIHYSPSGTRILAGSEGGGAKVFSTVTGELLYELDYSLIE